MRSVLAGLRRLVVPWGARGNTPRVVLGTGDPALNVIGQLAGMVWYWRDKKAYVMSVDPFGDHGQFHFHVVDDGAIAAEIFNMDYDETSGATAFSFNVPTNFIDGIRMGVSTQVSDSAPGATSTLSAAYVPTGVVCTTTFVGPPTGKGLLMWRSALDNSLAAGVAWAAPELVGGGGAFAASDAIAIATTGLDGDDKSSFTALSGLTRGAAYDATLMHRAQGGGTAFFARREIVFIPTM